MSSEIVYDKAFIKVRDKYIPMVCQGSSNCWDISPSGREIPEKNWYVLNNPYRGRILFSEAEIRDIAAQYKKICAESGSGIWKHRYNPFQPEEFERWILAGLKSARAIEEYVRYGNCLYLTDYDTSLRLPIRSEKELLENLPRYTGSPALQLRFFSRDIYLPKKARKGPPDFSKLERYFVIATDRGYFVKLSKNRTWHTPSIEISKKFVAEQQANQYLKRNAERLSGCGYRVQCVENKEAMV